MKENTKEKLVKGSLVALAIAPVVTNVIPASADEVVSYDLPGIDGRPEETPEVPQPPVVEPEQPSVPEKPEQPEVPSVPDTPSEPTPDPAPPVYVPEITSEVTYNATSYEDVIVKQSEVNNVLALANINITKTTVTKEYGVPVSSIQEVVSPVLVGSVDNTLGVKEVVYTTAGSTNTWSFNVNVVSDNAVVSADRGLAINIDNPSVKITQSQAQAMTKVEDFINLNKVSGVNAKGQTQTIAIPNQQAVLDVANGVVGVHTIQYGIDSTSTLDTRDKFIATATIEVEYEEQVDETVDGQVDGTVNASQLKGEVGNQNTKGSSNQENEVLQTSGYYTPNTGVSIQSLALFSVMAVAGISLFMLRKNHK